MSMPRPTPGPGLALAATLVAAATSCAVTPRYPDDALRVAALVGGRQLDDEVEPLDEQPFVGLELDWVTADPNWRYELGLSYGTEDDTGGAGDAELSLWELYGGVRWLVGNWRLRPYLGGGFSFAKAELDVPGASPSDGSLGGYLHGGVTFDLTRHVFVGIDFHSRLGQDYDLDGVEVEGLHHQAAVVLGFAP